MVNRRVILFTVELCITLTYMLLFRVSGMETTHSNHAVCTTNYHFVWCPRCRHSFLNWVEDTLGSEFHTIVKRYDYELRSLHISPDHVHVVLEAHPKHAPSEIVSWLKSMTAPNYGRTIPRRRKCCFGVVGIGNDRSMWGRRVK